MSVNRLMICSVDPKYTADYIANVFWGKDIGKVSSITLIPQIVDSEVSNTAYVTFSSFCDSESARDFVSHFKCIRGVNIFYHALPEHDNIWLLEPNTHYYGELCVGGFTTKFTDDFFVPKQVKPQQVADDNESSMNDDEVEEFERRYPIRGFDGHYSSIETALDYLKALNEECDETEDEVMRSRIAKEIEYYEMELAKHFDISKLQDIYTQYMRNMTNEELEEDWRNYMMRDLLNCTMPSMERQVAMTDQEIEDLLEEQEEYQKYF